jgi:hypothetical protein
MVVSAPTAAGVARTRSNDSTERLMMQQHLLLTPIPHREGQSSLAGRAVPVLEILRADA